MGDREFVTKTNFTAGELSPSLYGRHDIRKYANGCKEITNFIVRKHGGLEKRGGTKYVAAVKNQSYRDLVMESEPTVYFRLGDSSGSGALNEAGFAGVFVGSPTLGVAGAIDGDSDTAVTLNGTSQYIRAGFGVYGGMGSLMATAGITIELWIKGGSLGTSDGIVTATNTGGANAQYMYFSVKASNADALSFFVSEDSGTDYIEYTTDDDIGINDGGWHHIAVVADPTGQSGQFYVDGVAVTTNVNVSGGGADALVDFNSNLHVGAFYTTGGTYTAYLPGSVDEVALYSSQLSAEVLASHYALGSAAAPDTGQRLFPFQFNNEQAYAIEAGGRYLRFYRDNGALASQDVSTVTTNGGFLSGLTSWNATNVSADTDMIRAHFDTTGGSIYQALNISEADKNTVHTIRFKIDTGSQVGKTLGDKLTLNIGTSAGAGDILPDTEYQAGWHVVSFDPAGNTGSTAVYIEFTRAGSRDMYLDDVQVVDGSQIELETPYERGSLSELRMVQSADIVYIAHPDNQPMELRRYGDISWSLVYHSFYDGPYLDQNREPTDLDGDNLGASLTTFNAYIEGTTTDTTVGINGGEGFRASDVGRWLRHVDDSGGVTVSIITAVSDSNTVTVTPIAFSTASPVSDAREQAITWSLGAWGDAGDGEAERWPGAVCLHQSRLWWGGSDAQQQVLWSTVVNAFNDYTPSEYDGTILDDQGITLKAAENKVSRVYNLESISEGMLVNTSGGELLCRASQDFSPITPTDFNFRYQSGVGANPSTASVRNLNGDVVFVQYAGKRIYEAQYRFDVNRVRNQELTLLADHMTEVGIVDLDYAQEPDALLFAVLADGRVAVMAYEPSEEVLAWSHFEMGGASAAVESVTAIRKSSYDQVWMIVSREVDGATARGVEYMELTHDSLVASQGEAFYVDSGVSVTGGTRTPSSTQTVTGLSHLEGEAVVALCDGSYVSGLTVSSGQVTLSESYETVHIGLPYAATMETLELGPEGFPGGQVVRDKSLKKIHLRLRGSRGGSLVSADTGVEKPLVYAKTNDTLGSPPPLFTGVMAETPAELETRAQQTVKITHSEPLPFNLDQLVVLLEAGSETSKY